MWQDSGSTQQQGDWNHCPAHFVSKPATHRGQCFRLISRRCRRGRSANPPAMPVRRGAPGPLSRAPPPFAKFARHRRIRRSVSAEDGTVTGASPPYTTPDRSVWRNNPHSLPIDPGRGFASLLETRGIGVPAVPRRQRTIHALIRLCPFRREHSQRSRKPAPPAQRAELAPVNRVQPNGSAGSDAGLRPLCGPGRRAGHRPRCGLRRRVDAGGFCGYGGFGGFEHGCLVVVVGGFDEDDLAAAFGPWRCSVVVERHHQQQGVAAQWCVGSGGVADPAGQQRRPGECAHPCCRQ